MTKNKKIIISTDIDDFFAESSALFDIYNIEAMQVAKNGESLFNAIISCEPDIVLMDVFMPHLDAVGVVQAVRKTVPKNCPMFFTVSDFDSPALQRELTTNKIDYFFVRPIETSILVSRIIDVAKPEKAYQGNNLEILYNNPGPTHDYDLESLVTEIIHQIGVPAHIKGYHYLRDSIILVVENPEIINYVTKKLYTSVAAQNGTTSSRVERAIRHAIEVAWDRGDVDVLNSYFGYTVHSQRGKPTNSEFIAMISDKLRLLLRNPSQSNNYVFSRDNVI